MPDWSDRVVLGPGESLRINRSSSEGFMQETDVHDCSIIGASGAVVGQVRATDHTAINGFKRTLSVKQTTSSGSVVVDETWTA
jgi:hypothetical protein